jgi:hypothetical protein
MSFPHPVVRTLFQTTLRWGTDDYVILQHSPESDRYRNLDDEWEITYYSREPWRLHDIEATADHIRSLLEEFFKLHIGHYIGHFRCVPVNIVGCDNGHIGWHETIGPYRHSSWCPPEICENTDDRWFCFPVFKDDENDSIALQYSSTNPNQEGGRIWTRLWTEEMFRAVQDQDTSCPPCACVRCTDPGYPHR